MWQKSQIILVMLNLMFLLKLCFVNILNEDIVWLEYKATKR
jgi:hypothetical protein